YWAAAGELGGSFFFSRGQADSRMDVSSPAPSLFSPLTTSPASCRAYSQLKKSILELLQGFIDAPSPVVPVLDTVEECSNPTRPKVHLEKSFTHFISPMVSNITTLHDIGVSIVKGHIQLCLRTRLQGAEAIATDGG
ncbi:hypothetical protein FRB96_003663, partial [Tulasnella sp. 330]